MAKCNNKYIPEYVPKNLKWYERDGLETWYLQNKCNDFINNTEEHFKQMKITNFDIIKKNVQKNLSNIKHWTITKVCSIRHNYESKFALLYSEMQIEKTCISKKKQ